MSGTRKMEKFEVERSTSFKSGTRKMEKLASPIEPPIVSVTTPVAFPTPADLAATRPSTLPEETVTPEKADAPEETLADEDPSPPPSPSRPPRGADREPDVEKLRTRLARKFTTLADRVTDGFDEFQIGAGWWVVELTAPEGMSTGGGKQMLQHLRLRPMRQGHSVIVGGVVNAVDKTAELREHAHVEMIHRARFGQALEITAAEWEQFLRKAETVLRQEQIRTSRVAAPRDIAIIAQKTTRAHAAAARKKRLAAIALGVSTLAAAFVVWRVLVALWP